MGYYDFFSRFYDRSLEDLYRDHRTAAAEALRLAPGMTVLDAPCGTGQSFDAVHAGIHPGMLGKARDRVARLGMEGVHLADGDVQTLTAGDLARAAGRPVAPVDRLLVFLGMTVFPDWRGAFANLWSLLAPGGRAVIVDCYKARLGLQGRLVNLTARADIRRPVWEALEERCEGFVREELPSLPEHGGTIYLAAGDKPAG